MIDFSLPALAVMLLVVGVTILWKQSRAGTCSKHNRAVGGVATVLGWGSVIAGVGVAVFAVLLGRSG